MFRTVHGSRSTARGKWRKRHLCRHAWRSIAWYWKERYAWKHEEGWNKYLLILSNLLSLSSVALQVRLCVRGTVTSVTRDCVTVKSAHQTDAKNCIYIHFNSSLSRVFRPKIARHDASPASFFCCKRASGYQFFLFVSGSDFISSFSCVIFPRKSYIHSAVGPFFQEGVALFEYFDLFHSRLHFICVVDFLVSENNAIIFLGVDTLLNHCLSCGRIIW